MRTSLSISGIATLASVAVTAQISIRPGQYEMTTTMNLAMPAEAQKAIMDAAGLGGQQKRLECLDEDVKDAKGLVDLYQRELGAENCTISSVKTSGNKVTFALACQEDDVKMTGTTETTFEPDAFTTSSVMKDGDGKASTVKVTARRVGACPG